MTMRILALDRKSGATTTKSAGAASVRLASLPRAMRKHDRQSTALSHA